MLKTYMLTYGLYYKNYDRIISMANRAKEMAMNAFHRILHNHEPTKTNRFVTLMKIQVPNILLQIICIICNEEPSVLGGSTGPG